MAKGKIYNLKKELILFTVYQFQSMFYIDEMNWAPAFQA